MTSRPECRSQPETGSWVGVKEVKHDASGLSPSTKRDTHASCQTTKANRRKAEGSCPGEERRLACAPAERVLGKVVGAASVVAEVRVEAALGGRVLPGFEAQMPARPTKHMTFADPLSEQARQFGKAQGAGG